MAAVGVAAREGEEAAPAVANTHGGVSGDGEGGTMNAEDVAVGMEMEALDPSGLAWVPAKVVHRGAIAERGAVAPSWFTVSIMGDGFLYARRFPDELRPKGGAGEDAAARMGRMRDENLRGAFGGGGAGR